MIFKGLELHFVRCHPDFPNKKWDPDNPSWEVQTRTRSKELKKQMEDAGIKVASVIPEGDEPPYFKVTFRKKVKKKDGGISSPVEVVDGSKAQIDPSTIGNGSIGNVRVYQYPYPKKGGGEAFATILMGLQVTKHVVYERKGRREDFEETGTEVVTPDESEDARY